MNCSVSELLERFDSQELAEWMAYHRIEPFGERQATYMTASQMALAANMNSKKGSKPFTAEDFLPVIKKPMTQEEISKNISLAFGGK